MDNLKNAFLGFIVLIALIQSAYAGEIRYITDQFEIALQKSKDPNSQVIMRLKSGAPVEVLQAAGADGYARVSTFNNEVGWILDSFLMQQPGGRDQYLAINKEYQKLKKEIDSRVQERTESLLAELEKLKKTAKRPLQLKEENQRLIKTLEEERASVEEIKQENREFKSIHKDRRWFIAGAITAIGSLLLGLIITRIPWQRRKSWGEL